MNYVVRRIVALVQATVLEHHAVRPAHPADRNTLLHLSSRTVFDLQCISVTHARCVCLSLHLQARSATDSGAASSEAVSPRQLSGRSTGTGVAPWGGGQAAGQRGLPKVQSHALLLEPDDEEASREGIIVPRQVRWGPEQQAGCGQATAASGNPGVTLDVAAEMWQPDVACPCGRKDGGYACNATEELWI